MKDDLLRTDERINDDIILALAYNVNIVCMYDYG